MVVWFDKNIIIEVNELYYKVIIGKTTWYWDKDTCRFDGTSIEID